MFRNYTQIFAYVYFESVLFHCGLMFVSLVVTVLLYLCCYMSKLQYFYDTCVHGFWLLLFVVYFIFANTLKCAVFILILTNLN